MRIRQADMKDVPVLAELACLLWPSHRIEEMREEMTEIFSKPDAAFFLAIAEARAVGFAQCQLRHDYVEGTENSPVGYLEGIYVMPGHRHRGIAKQLLHACESWAKSRNCTEFASDCELTNGESLQFHLNVGFAEANRIICFVKKL
jgi:aminoglycoside 6'-N-acetyltransferase I